MINGHVGAAFVARRRLPSASMAALLAVSFLPDLTRSALVLAGVGLNAANIYSHAAPYCVLVALAGALILWLPQRSASAAIVGFLLAMSHVLLDIVSGSKQLWVGGPSGFDLDESFWQNEFVIESLILAFGWALLPRTDRVRKIGWKLPVTLMMLQLAGLVAKVYQSDSWRESCLAFPYEYCDGSTILRTPMRDRPEGRHMNRVRFVRDSLRRARQSAP